jgi:hypothetical protein
MSAALMPDTSHMALPVPHNAVVGVPLFRVECARCGLPVASLNSSTTKRPVGVVPRRWHRQAPPVGHVLAASHAPC